MTAKEYLTRIRDMATRVRFLQDELERLRTDAASTSINIDGMPRVMGGKSDKLERLAIKLAEYDDQLQSELTRLLAEKQTAVRLIAELPPKEQTILTERYIHAKKWEQIAYEMDITWRHCYRLHGRALCSFDKVLNKLQ